MGPDRVCFGSDFPHPEGLDEPLEFADQVPDLAETDLRKIMSDNMFELVGVFKPVAA